MEVTTKEDGGSLKSLQERANRLSEELQTLQSDDQDKDSSSSTCDDIQEVLKRYTSDDDRDLEEEDLKVITKVLGKDKADELRRKQLTRTIEVDQNAIDEALDMIANFKPKRPRKPMPMYPDFSVEGEKAARRKPGGSSYWLMPFRGQEFVSSLENDER